MPKATPTVPRGRWWSRRLHSVPVWVWTVGAVVALATVSRVSTSASDDRSASAGPVPGTSPTPVVATTIGATLATTLAPPTPATTIVPVAPATTIVLTVPATTIGPVTPAPAIVPVTPATTIVLTVPPGQCDPNYSGACVPIAEDVDCSGTGGDGPAFVRGPVLVIGNDVYGLDGPNGDGVGCDG